MRNRNIVTMLATGLLACFGFLPQTNAAPEVAPPPDGCYPNFTTAEGCQALQFLTSGAGNTGLGWRSLYATAAGNFNTGVGAGALVLNTDNDNTAVGAVALLLNTSGSDNTAVGAAALEFNDAGSRNVAVGGFALTNNTGSSNTALGFQALEFNISHVTNVGVGVFAAQNTDASFNTAVGGFSLQANTSGTRNTAVGAGALEPLASGSDNTAVGELAGANYTGSESGNISIGSNVEGTAGESNTIRIGSNLPSGGINVSDAGVVQAFTIGGGFLGGGFLYLELGGLRSFSIGDTFSTVNGNSSCFIGGIYNQGFGPADMAVRVGSNNKLGTVVSSRRFKHDIKPMDNASEAILSLKPVTFQYNSDTTNTPRVGLVAEDVAEVSRGLVIADQEGKPLSVRYEDVNVMLLNEFIKEHKKVEQLQATVAQQQKGMDVLTAQLKEQAAQIQKVSAQVEMNKPAPQVVANKP